MPSLGFPEILLLLVLIVVLFGAKRLPDAARSLGRSMRIFKSEVKEMANDDDNPQPQQITGTGYQAPQPGQPNPAASQQQPVDPLNNPNQQQ
ncbi:Sec-independent protein translocase subunit TatA [Corynebacterium mendelii]|uniref:Sec-independent protein translocase protein TatA n=1 Tax=Corynebacterium mendelii TaxID=2765362 RepID=A0A939E0X5_9CORY|nr:Sec-independent protein translocase subunit TatA [Corynebacterium mendelii]